MPTLYFTPQRKKVRAKSYADYLRESTLPERVKKYWLKERWKDKK